MGASERGGRLNGRVAFVTVTGGDERSEALTRALVEEGVMVVLVADDAEAAGRLAATFAGGTAVFCPGGEVGADVDALVELAGELVGRS